MQTKRGATAYELELRLELSTPSPGAEPAQDVPTLAEFAEEWMTTDVAVHNKPSDQARKRCTLRNHVAPFFGKQRLDQITTRQIDAFKAKQVGKGLKVTTINQHLKLLRRVLRFAHSWGVLTDVPAVRMFPTPSADAFDWLRPAEAGRLLDVAEAMNQRWFTVFLLALRTGMRKGEIFALHWSAVDFDRRRVTVEFSTWRGQLSTPKTGKTRVIPMSADLVDALRAWRLKSSGELVFPDRDGRSVLRDPMSANRALHRALTRAGLRHVRFHDLRHTFASHLLLRGMSLKIVQVLLGHSSVTMTEKYAHVADEQLVTAVEALDGLGRAGAVGG